MDAFYSQLLIVLMVVSGALIFKFMYHKILNLMENESKPKESSQSTCKPDNVRIHPRAPLNEGARSKEENTDA